MTDYAPPCHAYFPAAGVSCMRDAEVAVSGPRGEVGLCRRCAARWSAGDERLELPAGGGDAAGAVRMIVETLPGLLATNGVTL